MLDKVREFLKSLNQKAPAALEAQVDAAIAELAAVRGRIVEAQAAADKRIDALLDQVRLLGSQKLSLASLASRVGSMLGANN